MEQGTKRKELMLTRCVEACPAHIDVPRYIRNIKEGDFAQALAVVREALPLPTICADACFAPCEGACAYRQYGDPIAIRALKRAAADMGGDAWKAMKKRATKTGKKVAIVGAGPCGLTAAYSLASAGHTVTLYDQAEKPGGMMRYGIPCYRLPEARLDRDINEILSLGVTFKGNVAVGKKLLLSNLKKESDVVLLAVGLSKSIKLDIPGADQNGVLGALDFLGDVARGKSPRISGNVVVIGGGNVAIDTALTAKRLGAEKVTLVCLESAKEMPAHEWEVARAKEEGIIIQNGWGPKEIKGTSSVSAIEFKKCTSVFDKKGKFSPKYDETANISMDARHVILAVGQTADFIFLEGEKQVLSGHTVVVAPDTLQTGAAGIFAGGDVVSGPASIIEAVAHGKKAAAAIDKYLGGKGVIEEKLALPEADGAMPDCRIQVKPRAGMSLLSVGERGIGFEQIERGLTGSQAQQESRRCLMCDRRSFEVTVFPENCKECGYCAEVCSLGVFGFSDVFNKKGYRPAKTQNAEKCIGCMRCFYACPDFAINISGQSCAKERCSG